MLSALSFAYAFQVEPEVTDFNPSVPVSLMDGFKRSGHGFLSSNNPGIQLLLFGAIQFCPFRAKPLYRNSIVPRFYT